MSLTEKDWQKIIVVELGLILLILLLEFLCTMQWCAR